MIANVDAYKSIGVRKHGIADDTPDDWESHTLASLTGLQANEQTQLTLHLEELTNGADESLYDFKLRVKNSL